MAVRTSAELRDMAAAVLADDAPDESILPSAAAALVTDVVDSVPSLAEPDVLAATLAAILEGPNVTIERTARDSITITAHVPSAPASPALGDRALQVASAGDGGNSDLAAREDHVHALELDAAGSLQFNAQQELGLTPAARQALARSGSGGLTQSQVDARARAVILERRKAGDAAIRMTIFPISFRNAAAIRGSHKCILHGIRREVLFDGISPAVNRFDLIETLSDTRVHTQSWSYVGEDQELEFEISAQEATDIANTGSEDYTEFVGRFFNNNGLVAQTTLVTVPIGETAAFPAKLGDLPPPSLRVDATPSQIDKNNIPSRFNFYLQYLRGAFPAAATVSIGFLGRTINPAATFDPATSSHVVTRPVSAADRTYIAAQTEGHSHTATVRLLDSSGKEVTEATATFTFVEGASGGTPVSGEKPVAVLEPYSWRRDGEAHAFDVILAGAPARSGFLDDVDKVRINVGGFSTDVDWTKTSPRKFSFTINANNSETINTNAAGGPVNVSVSFHKTGGGAASSANSVLTLDRFNIPSLVAPVGSGLNQGQVDARVRAVPGPVIIVSNITAYDAANNQFEDSSGDPVTVPNGSIVTLTQAVYDAAVADSDFTPNANAIFLTR